MPPPQRNEVLIYSGEGVGEISFAEALASLNRALPNFEIRSTSHSELKSSSWHRTTAVLVFPGGADLPYCRSLDGAGTESIRTYISNGGRYLGFCAGAYFACREIEFERGTPNEVTGPRRLALFSGRGVGQAVSPGAFDYRDGNSACVTRITSMTARQELPLYFEGGCYFDRCPEDVEILARYAELPEQPPAIILAPFGRGWALLSGPHPEFSYAGAACIRPPLGETLEGTEPLRIQFLNDLVGRLLSHA